MAKLETIENDGHYGHHTDLEFSKKTGIMYCLSCGKECLCDDGMCECGKNKFLNASSSEFIGGYIELAKKDKLKAFYDKARYSKSVVKMNPKRIIHQLLMHKHKIEIKKEFVDKIYGSNII